MVTVTRRDPNATQRRGRQDVWREMDRLFDDFLEGRRSGWSRWTPPTDLYETDSAFLVEMELPGFTQDDIEVTVEKGVLSVGGEARPVSDESRTYHLQERPTGRFSRSFALPASIRTEEVEASFDNGLLHVRLPKAVEAQPRRIEVR